MCGIYFYLTYNFPNNKLLLERGNKCSHRGPDNSKHIIIKKDNANILFLFHRLSINGLNEESNQPFQFEKYTNITVMCNGEIYNYKELAEKYNIELISDSDCEIIIHLYNILPIQEFINELDGVFSFVIYDGNNDIVVIGHDPIGIRSLYYSQKDNYFSISSEMKCLDSFYENNVTFFPPGSYGIYNIKNKNLRITPYYKFNYNIIQEDTSKIIKNIKDKLEKAVQKRLLSDRPIGCLLSGGLDSSIIASILKKHNPNIKTFSIGLKDSPDVIASQKVADYLKTDHTNIIISEEEMLNAIEDTIYQIESSDITTIRASVPMYLLSKYIAKNTDIKVIFSGEGSDEASGSYLYFHNAPTPTDFQNECIRLLKDVHMFDVLRGDKTTAGNGLEIRVPFFDKEFINYYMSIDPKKKCITNGVEKYLLRRSFENDLPKEIVWRRKDGFSDGVSKLDKPWYEIIEEYAQSKYKLSESNMYKMLYTKHYHSNNIPYTWMPKWSGELTNPSGRLIIN
tara:strand:- start:3777 stop:5306 length:1530 start_codon:yes stop_codon:yes gene_type:complete